MSMTVWNGSRNNRFVKNEATRQDLIRIELNKYFEKSDNKDSLILKEERRDEVIKILKIYPYDDQFWNNLN